ncbi:dimethylglycine dehydrogenase, mitochondrial-like isoform X2 [Tachypleus tridentatus]|uniref:dimethylglycine dehydrogenase, mitochondrial-like isoform X2 n=2 Tax=Tachypleus tridentatus TaxID=6853 RepID=UPI003FD2C44A
MSDVSLFVYMYYLFQQAAFPKVVVCILHCAMARAAQKHGANIMEGVLVTGLKLNNGRWDVETPKGFWAHEIGRMVGVEFLLVPIHHQYLMTSTIPK